MNVNLHGEDVAAAVRLLPAWFTERMMTDTWHFGLLLSTGDVLCISHIDNVRAGIDGVWIDVTMADHNNITEIPVVDKRRVIYTPASDRREVSVQASHVVAAFEMATS